MMKTQNEIIKQGYDALINSLGVTDTIRFIQPQPPGFPTVRRWGGMADVVCATNSNSCTAL